MNIVEKLEYIILRDREVFKQDYTQSLAVCTENNVLGLSKYLNRRVK